MNFAKPDMPLPAVVDLVSLNYQGEGIRDAPGYEQLQGIRTPPLYPDFHAAFPGKVILSSENAAAVSSRGTYLFPVAAESSAPVLDVAGARRTGHSRACFFLRRRGGALPQWRSLGRRAIGAGVYRLRWDDVVYEPGELRVVAYEAGAVWAEQVVRTAGAPAALAASTDRDVIRADGDDLAFVTVHVADAAGLIAPRASDLIQFQIQGRGEIVATDSGDPTDLTAFPAHERRAFGGSALAIVRAYRGEAGEIRLSATSGSLQTGSVTLQSVVRRDSRPAKMAAQGEPPAPPTLSVPPSPAPPVPPKAVPPAPRSSLPPAPPWPPKPRSVAPPRPAAPPSSERPPIPPEPSRPVSPPAPSSSSPNAPPIPVGSVCAPGRAGAI